VALLAGASAGFATQFKLTYVAALAAGLLWLAINRRWKSLASFALGGALTSIGIYLFFVLREPRMLDGVLSLGKPITDITGLADSIHRVLAEPAALLGLAALPFLPWRSRGKWTLVVGFAAISFCIAAITDLQVGGNINYFYEAMFGLVPLAAFAILQLRRPNYVVAGLFLAGLLLVDVPTILWRDALRFEAPACLLGLAAFAVWRIRRSSCAVAGLLLCALLLIRSPLPLGMEALRIVRAAPASTAEQNRMTGVFRAAFRDRQVLSFVPNATACAYEADMVDPFAVSYFERVGKLDLHPLAGQIRAQAFDMIVTSIGPASYRGIDLVSPTLGSAIREAYRPFCEMAGVEILLPRNAEDALTGRLIGLGCDATAHPPR